MRLFSYLLSKFRTYDPKETDRRRFVFDYASALILMTICSGAYLAGLLKYSGVSVQMTGIISAVPVTAAIFQVLGAVVLQGIQREKRFILGGVIIHRVSMTLMFFMPVIFGKTLICVLAIVVLYCIGHFANAAISPAMSNWIISTTPDHIRANYFSQREKYGLICTAVIALSVSFVFDRFQEDNLKQIGFIIVGFILLIVAVFDISQVLKISNIEKEMKSSMSLASVLVPIKDKSFTKVIILFIMFQASMQIWLPFTGIYLINDIKIKYTLLGAVAVMVSIEKAVLVPFWGKLVSKTSWSNALFIAIGIYGFGGVFFILLNSHNGTWMYIIHVLIANVAWSVIGIALFNIQFQYIKGEDKAIYVGVCGAISGVSGFLFALVGSQIYSFINKAQLLLNGMQVLVILSMSISVIMCIYLKSWKLEK